MTGFEPLYDAIVVGGGFAGLSAALQLARFNRHVLVLDSGVGRSTFHQVNHNYLGFPGGVPARELRLLARKQLAMYPAAVIDEAAVEVNVVDQGFLVATSSEEVSGRTLVFATGVQDEFPAFPGWASYVGRSVFWCIVCDGYSTRGKRTLVVGNDDECAVTALQFLQFTNRVTLLTNAATCEITAKARRSLDAHGVPLVEGEIAGVQGHDGILGAVDLRSGERLPTDFLFSLQGQTPHSDLAARIGVKTNRAGYIAVDSEQHTNVQGVFAAGDVTRGLSHQVATAVQEGITAATSAQHYLYEPWQRHRG